MYRKNPKHWKLPAHPGVISGRPWLQATMPRWTLAREDHIQHFGDYSNYVTTEEAIVSSPTAEMLAPIRNGSKVGPQCAGSRQLGKFNKVPLCWVSEWWTTLGRRSTWRSRLASPWGRASWLHEGNPDGTWWNCRTGHLLGAWNTLLRFVKAAYTWAWCNLLWSRLVSMQVGYGQHRTTLGAWKHSMDHYQLIYMTIMTWTQTLCQLENWQQLAATKFAAPGAHFLLAGAFELFVRCERIWKAWQPLAKCSASCRALSRSSCRHFHYAGLSAGGVETGYVIYHLCLSFHVVSCYFMSFHVICTLCRCIPVLTYTVWTRAFHLLRLASVGFKASLL